MKRLKFDSKFERPIKNGMKYKTIRFKDEKHIKGGDKLKLLTTDYERIGTAKVISTYKLEIKFFKPHHLNGHNCDSVEELFDTLKEYYSEIERNNKVKVIIFDIGIYD